MLVTFVVAAHFGNTRKDAKVQLINVEHVEC